MVKTVDPTLSIAILWSHPDFRVSAQSADGRTFGIVAAHLDDAEGRNLLELRGVPLRSSLEPGTEIWSSGAGNVYPKGIPIGTVIGEVKAPAEVWARTYILKPAVNPAAVDAVIILHPERGDSLPGVWQTRVQADSIAKSVVAAAESLARKVAADSIAAEKRRDSVARADSIRDARPRVPIVSPPAPPASGDTLPRPGVR
jgi:rod shape-determining protein MreC